MLNQKIWIRTKTIEEKSLNKETGKEFTQIYDFHRLIKVKENKDRYQRHDLKIDSRKKRLRSPLQIGKKVFVLSEHLKKKDALGKFYTSSTENKTFFNRHRIFTIVNRSKKKRSRLYLSDQRKR